MKKFVIKVAGVYFILLGIVITISSIYALTSFIRNKAVAPVLSIVFIVVFLIFGLLPVLTGIGVIRRKQWAYDYAKSVSLFISIPGLVIGALYFILMSRDIQLFYNITAEAVVGAFLTLVALPVFFRLFFDKEATKEVFYS